MRSTSFNPPSPSNSSESFFLHDPQEVIYNRVKDIFESDASIREEPLNRNNALTVQAEIHSSSSGAASCSDDETQENVKSNNKIYNVENKAPQTSSNHDYEDIYLVREEAKSEARKFYGRSRSRDSGSHSRSASTSSTRSHDVVLHSNNPMHFDNSSRYEVPRKNDDKAVSSQPIQSSHVNTDTTYESVETPDNVYERRNNSLASSVNKKISSPIDAPPLPPPLPPHLLMKSHQNMMANANRDSNDSLDFSHVDDDLLSLESDSGLEVVEEPTLRPSELVRGNNNRSMSIISGEIFIFL